MRKDIRFSALAGLCLLGGAVLASCGNKSDNKQNETEDTVVVAVDTVQTAQGEAVEEAVMVNLPDSVYPKITGKAVSDQGFTKTKSGLKYRVLKEGTGIQPTAQDAVTVHYTGTLMNGQKFDSSVDRNEPATFPLNRVIAGWTEGLQLMKEGAVYEFIIPANLAYGEREIPTDNGPIPANSDLYFAVQLIKVNK